MTTKDLSATNNQQTPSAGLHSLSHAPTGTPSASIALAAGQSLAADVPETITAVANPGTHWIWSTHGLAFGSRVIVGYAGGIRISVDGARAAGGSGGTT